MFDKSTYIKRRTDLRNSLQSGLILILGEYKIPINYRGNCYPFKQDANFLYFTGLADRAGLALVIDIDGDTECLYGNNESVDDEIWNGKKPTLSELSARSGISKIEPLKNLRSTI